MYDRYYYCRILSRQHALINYTQERSLMKKGFKPTEHKKLMKNMRDALMRKTKEFKKALNNPLFVAAHLDTKTTDKIE